MIAVYADSESLGRAAAQLFASKAQGAVEAGRFFSVALAGGGTPPRTYELLATRPLRDEIPWERVHVFWGDERCVPVDDPRSNVRMARDALLEHVPIPEVNIHPPSCVGAPARGASRYEAELRDFFASMAPRFDLVLLGLGEDGHTASLFPHAHALDETERWVAEVYMAEQDLFRVTFTASLINRAALVAFLVSGQAKAETLREVLEGPRQPRRWPAQLIAPVEGELYWLVDQAAASRLSRGHMDTEGRAGT